MARLPMARIALELRNATELEFTDISSEIWRCYYFPGGEKVLIEAPQWLYVSKAGGHRIVDGCGHSHYIPFKWIHLEWEVLDGAPHFVR